VQEGHARELVNRIQNLRKESELDVADRIALSITGDADLLAAVEAHREMIAAETLAEKLTTADGGGDLDINGHPCGLVLAKL
jgi:isoleucyl-tRNA synthetase